MFNRTKYCLNFSEIGKKDIPVAGGKGANLGEMYNAGFPVPPGFVISSKAYFDFIDKTSLREKIKSFGFIQFWLDFLFADLQT